MREKGWETDRKVRKDSNPNSVGMVPVRLLLSRNLRRKGKQSTEIVKYPKQCDDGTDSKVKLVIPPISVGMLPQRRFESNSRA